MQVPGCIIRVLLDYDEALTLVSFQSSPGDSFVYSGFRSTVLPLKDGGEVPMKKHVAAPGTKQHVKFLFPVSGGISSASSKAIHKPGPRIL
jgi:hypothetical protein